MPFLFTCPHCGTRTEVEDRYSGLAGECVTCGKSIQLPAFAAAVTSAGITPGGTGASNPPVGNRRKRSLTTIVAATAVLLVLLGSAGYALIHFGGRAVTNMQNSQGRLVSSGNLRKIAEALNAYADDHGRYPPPFTKDASGRPLHSWRVLILPYLGERQLYDQIALTLPWDADANSQFHYTPPAVYSHPRSGGYGIGCPYQLFVGGQGLFPTGKSLGPNDLIDEPTKTILVAEVLTDDYRNNWMAPRDLDIDLVFVDPATFAQEVIGINSDGIMVATVDGRVHRMPRRTSFLVVEALVTPRGGEPLPDDVLDSVMSP